jgi:hypothetical protein
MSVYSSEIWGIPETFVLYVCSLILACSKISVQQRWRCKTIGLFFKWDLFLQKSHEVKLQGIVLHC